MMKPPESSHSPSSLPTGPTIIKVGGSLLDWPELSSRLRAFLNVEVDRESEDCTKVGLIVGGGAAADFIRAMDRIHRLGDEAAHRLAIRALDLSAQLLRSLLPGSSVVTRPEELRAAWDRREVPILSPRRFLEELDDHCPDPLPASWDVTTDSIAARIATHLGASRLVLLKSARLPTGIDREEAARLGLVDPMFPRIAGELELVEYVSLREPAAVRQVLPL
jgi:5-(aminomethyl)-3-furanmethanol phosphate kinase